MSTSAAPASFSTEGGRSKTRPFENVAWRISARPHNINQKEPEPPLDNRSGYPINSDDGQLYVGGVKYRLCGIDAPEHGHPGYHQAIDYLHSLIRGKKIECTLVGQVSVCIGS